MLSAILSSLSEEILGQVLFLSTSTQVWKALGEMFASHSKARIMQVRLQLANTKKKDNLVTYYFQKMKSLIDTMASICYPLRDEEVAKYILARLENDYDSLVTLVTTRLEPIFLNDLYAHIVSYELRQEINNVEVQTGFSANNVIRGATNYINSGINNNNSNSNRGTRPMWRGCARGHGSPGRGYKVNNNNANQLTCQVCGKIGHAALRCYHRFA